MKFVKIAVLVSMLFAAAELFARTGFSGAADTEVHRLLRTMTVGSTRQKMAAEKQLVSRSRDDGAFREAAVDGLSRLLDKPQLGDMTLIVTADALGHLGGTKATEALTRHIDRGTEVTGLSLGHYPAAAALVLIGKPAVPYVLNALRDRNANKRIAAAKALGSMKDESVVPELRSALARETNADARFWMKNAIEVLQRSRH